jgi:hypothetical protein
MKYLKRFESKISIDNFYQPEIMYYISFCEGESKSTVKNKDGKLDYFKNLDDVIEYSKELVKKFNSEKLNFKVYYDENGDDPIIYFLFKRQKDVPKIYQPYPLELSEENYLVGWKPDEIPNNDLDLFFDVKKYNL